MAFFNPTQPEFIQRSNLDKQQQGVISDLLSQGQQGLKNTPSSFSPIRDYYQRQHVQQTLPNVRRQFAGQNGPLLGGLLGAENDLASKLAAMEQQFNMDQRGQFLNMIGAGMVPTFSEKYIPGEESALGKFGGELGMEFARQIPSYALSGTSAGGEKDDENSWINKFKEMLKRFGPALLNFIPGFGPTAGALAQAGVDYSNKPAGQTPFNQPQAQLNRNDFSGANLYKATGKLPQYSPLPFGVR